MIIMAESMAGGGRHGAAAAADNNQNAKMEMACLAWAFGTLKAHPQ